MHLKTIVQITIQGFLKRSRTGSAGRNVLDMNDLTAIGGLSREMVEKSRRVHYVSCQTCPGAPPSP